MSTSQTAFVPSGKTIAIAADAVAPVGVQAPSSSSPTGQYRVVNSGTNVVFLGTGPTAALAQSNSVAPVSGTPSQVIALLPGAVEVLSFGNAAFFSGLASAATTVYITPGSGV